MTTWTHVGNVDKFVMTPKPETKDHMASMFGSKVVDKIATIYRDGEFQMECDEFTPDNAVMALLGLAGTNTSGDVTVAIMGVSEVRRQIKFTGTNDFGPRVQIILPNVFLFCKDAINLIFDDWGKLPISGRILAVDGVFGTIDFLTGATGSAPITAPSTLNYYIGKGNVYTAPVAA